MRGRWPVSWALLEQPFPFEGLAISWNPVAGCARYPQHDRLPERLVEKAALATSMASPQRRVLYFEEESSRLREQRLLLTLKLDQAIAAGELTLHLQPQLDLANDRILWFEALVRWQHPVQGMIPPDVFIPYAEQTGLIGLVTRWLIDQVVILLRQFDEAGYPGVGLSINISAHDLTSTWLSEHLSHLIVECPQLKQRLCLEVTESAAMEDLETTLAVMAQLRELGFSLAMDDFGTGYSSLSVIQHMPLTELKIDRSLVDGVDTSEERQTLLRTAIAMGHGLGLRVVAEGVERTEEIEWLRQTPCQAAQGYLIARPMPVDEALDWLAAQTGDRHWISGAILGACPRWSRPRTMLRTAPRSIYSVRARCVPRMACAVSISQSVGRQVQEGAFHRLHVGLRDRRVCSDP